MNVTGPGQGWQGRGGSLTRGGPGSRAICESRYCQPWAKISGPLATSRAFTYLSGLGKPKLLLLFTLLAAVRRLGLTKCLVAARGEVARANYTFP